MALFVASGSGLWQTTDTVGTVFTHTGLGFALKALIVWRSLFGDSETQPDARCIGFATSVTDRRCNMVGGADASGSADTNAGNHAAAILALQASGASWDALLDIDSITADGFTLIVDDQITTGATCRYHWIALGGSDITAASTGVITEPGATGIVSYTAGAGFQPTLVFFSGTQLTTAAPSFAVVDSGFMIGAASGTGAGNQFVLATNSDDGSATMDTDQYLRFDQCLAMMTLAGGNPNALATFNGFDSVGFDLDWTARASTRQFIYLAIAAGSHVKVGKLTMDLATVGNTVTVSGLAFRPGVGFICGSSIQECAAGVSVAESVMSCGSFTTALNRRASAVRDRNGTAAAEIIQSYDAAVVWVQPGIALSTYDATIDINAVNDDGFQLIVDDALSGSVDLGYVVLGGVLVPPYAAPGSRLQGARHRRR
jgi:hypothetical protein